MNLAISVLGWAMLAVSLLAIGDGLPRQIWDSRKTRTAPRVLRRFMAWALAAYLLRAVYATATGTALIALAAVPGAAGMAILLWQSYRYPRTGPAPMLMTDGILILAPTPVDACYRDAEGKIVVEGRGEPPGSYWLLFDGAVHLIDHYAAT